MKEIDDTPVPESEYEHCEHAEQLARCVNKMLDILREHARVAQERIEALELRVATLESRRMLQNDPNDDEEWY